MTGRQNCRGNLIVFFNSYQALSDSLHDDFMLVKHNEVQAVGFFSVRIS